MYNILHGRKKSKHHVRRRYQDSPRSIRMDFATANKRTTFKVKGRKFIKFVPRGTEVRNVQGHYIFEGRENSTQRFNRLRRRPAKNFCNKNSYKSECQYRSYPEQDLVLLSPSSRQQRCQHQARFRSKPSHFY